MYVHCIFHHVADVYMYRSILQTSHKQKISGVVVTPISQNASPYGTDKNTSSVNNNVGANHWM